MVDFQSFFKYGYGEKFAQLDYVESGQGIQDIGCECESCKAEASNGNHRAVKFAGYDDVRPKDRTIDDETFFLLCSRRIPAFLLQDRSWGKLTCPSRTIISQMTDPYSKFMMAG